MDNRPTRAHRRPESVQRPSQQSPQNRAYRTGTSRQTEQRTPHPSRGGAVSGQNVPRPTSDPRPSGNPRTSGVQPSGYTSGMAHANRTSRPANAVRRVDDIKRQEAALVEAKKQQALEKKNRRWFKQYERDMVAYEKVAMAEAKWQNEVVRYKGTYDFWMCVFVLLLLVCGTVTVFSASYPLAVYEDNDPTAYIKRQIMYIGIGAVIAFFAMILDPKYYKKWLPFLLYTAGAVFLVAALFIGTREGATLRWIDLGPFNIQPSEVMKVGVIFLLAWYADRYEEKMNDITLNLGKQYVYNVLIPLGILGVAALLVLSGKHLSGFAITAAIGGLMMIVSTRRVGWLIGTAVPAAVVLGVGYLFANPYALKRVTAAVDEEVDTLGAMYQTLQSLNAIGSGGLLGVGFGESRQKYHFLTQSHTDFIFSVWCEETGFVGAVGLILLFLLIIWRGYTIARRASDKFSMLLAFGITTHMGIQAFLHMMVTTKLFVNTGVTLPFFSYGGSSLIIFMAEIGVLLCVSRHYYRKKSDVEREQLMKRMGMD